MHVTETQTRALLLTRQIYVTQACDHCGQILDHIRYTRRNESGEWCSRACRDGIDHSPGICRGCRTSLIGKRKGTTYCDRTCRMRAVRKHVRDSANIVNTSIRNTGLTDAVSSLGYVDSVPTKLPANRHARIEVNHER
jgi:hypothetical protein